LLDATRPRGYTTVMSLMTTMFEKGQLTRIPEGRAYRYAAANSRPRVLREMVGDLLSRAFRGSTSALVAHLLEQAQPTTAELDAVRKAIEVYENKSQGGS
ncbi:MAG: BlaI/MecI/CopY family transcriptional regulator, partial [Planctomycetales bacterium]|nr:BlaI/MecI/CopY family transcriptional regulator [Planctomycetales bacterium]